MTRDEAVRSVELGIELVREAAADNIFLLGAGDMGIGNTSSAAAILCALTGATPADVVGRGTGIDNATLARKIAAIQRGLQNNLPDANDPIDVLAKVGGLEIGAMIGVILAARTNRHCPRIKLPISQRYEDGILVAASQDCCVGHEQRG